MPTVYAYIAKLAGLQPGILRIPLTLPNHMARRKAYQSPFLIRKIVGNGNNVTALLPERLDNTSILSEGYIDAIQSKMKHSNLSNCIWVILVLGGLFKYLWFEKDESVAEVSFAKYISK